jgi:hypothetical protein
MRQKKVCILGIDYRIVLCDLDREVRRCFKCQRYGHNKLSCPSEIQACGKCWGTAPHGTAPHGLLLSRFLQMEVCQL